MLRPRLHPHRFTDSPLLDNSRATARSYYRATSRPVAEVPALTVDQCLADAGCQRLDFVSLDVEGWEAPALRGLDLVRWRPEYLLVECNEREAVEEVLGGNYAPERHLGERDILFKRTS